MTYHVARNNQQLGTFSKEDTLQRYNTGAILPTDLVWTEGMATWEPASKIFGAPIAPDGGGFTAPATPPPYAPPPITGVATPINAPLSGSAPAGAQRPGNGMIMAVIATVLSVLTCTFIPLVPSIIAIVFASQVDKKFNSGDVAGAQSSAKTAKILGIVSLVLCAVIFLIFFAIGFARGFSQAMQQRGY